MKGLCRIHPMQQKNQEQLQDEADRVGTKVLEKLLQMSLERPLHKRLNGSFLRFGMLRQVFKSLLSQRPPKPLGKLTPCKSQDKLDKCYRRQDLHLLHLQEIMHEQNFSKHKVWNVRIPKDFNLEKLVHRSDSFAPISHRSVIQFPLKDEGKTCQNKRYPEHVTHYPYWKDMV